MKVEAAASRFFRADLQTRGAVILGREARGGARGVAESAGGRRFSLTPKLPRHLPQKYKQMFVEYFPEKYVPASQTGNQGIFRGAGYVGRLREADRGGFSCRRSCEGANFR